MTFGECDQFPAKLSQERNSSCVVLHYFFTSRGGWVFFPISYSSEDAGTGWSCDEVADEQSTRMLQQVAVAGHGSLLAVAPAEDKSDDNFLAGLFLRTFLETQYLWLKSDLLSTGVSGQCCGCVTRQFKDVFVHPQLWMSWAFHLPTLGPEYMKTETNCTLSWSHLCTTLRYFGAQIEILQGVVENIQFTLVRRLLVLRHPHETVDRWRLHQVQISRLGENVRRYTNTKRVLREFLLLWIYDIARSSYFHLQTTLSLFISACRKCKICPDTNYGLTIRHFYLRTFAFLKQILPVHRGIQVKY